MNKSLPAMSTFIIPFVAAVALASALPVAAQSAGQWAVVVGENRISPKVESGDLSGPGLGGVKIDVKSAYAPIVGISYMITDNISTELKLGAPYRHDLIGKGTINGVGKIGDVQSFPPTLYAQYRFLAPASRFRPYVGLGVTYAYFRDAEASPTLVALLGPTTVKVDAKFAATPQIGMTYTINDKWFIESNLSKTYLKTRTTLNSSGTVRTIDTRLDPVAFSIGVGYKF